MSTGIDTLVAQGKLVADQAKGISSVPAAQRQKLEKIAAEFESMLMNQVLKDMRKSGKWDDEQEGSDSYGADTMFEMIDTELSSTLSKAGGFGLGKQMLEQLERMTGTSSTKQGDTGASSPTAAAGGPTMPAPIAMPTDAKAAVEMVKQAVEQYASNFGSGAEAMQAVGTTGYVTRPELVGRATDAVAQASAAVRSADAVTAAFSNQGATADVAPSPAPGSPTVTSQFGWRKDPMTGASKFHKGVDLRAAYGQDVQAAGGGRVVFSGSQGGYGTTVMVEHADGSKTRYAHLSVSLVNAGDTVAAGQALGRAGSSGRSTGPHLHFEVLNKEGQAVDPMNYRVS